MFAQLVYMHFVDLEKAFAQVPCGLPLSCPLSLILFKVFMDRTACKPSSGVSPLWWPENLELAPPSLSWKKMAYTLWVRDNLLA